MSSRIKNGKPQTRKTAAEIGKPPIRRTTEIDNKKKREKDKSEGAGLQNKVKQRISRETMTKSIQTKQPQLTSLQAKRQGRGKITKTSDKGTSSSLVEDRPKASIAHHETRVLKVAAVNINRNNKCQKPTAKLGGRAPSTAHTHPCTSTTTAAVATKTRSRMPPPAGHRRSTRSQPPSNTKQKAAKVLLPSITAPDVVAEALECNNREKQSSLDGDIPPHSLQRSDVPDPDVGNKHDPQLCAEYAKDIYDYLLELEGRRVYTIRENFLSHQPHVKKRHRTILVDWLVQVHRRFLLVPETLHLTVSILDRTLQAQITTKEDLQLLGVTAMLIASKVEDVYPPMIGELAYTAADTYTPEKIRKMEVVMLTNLDYQFNNPTVLLFLRRYSTLMATNKQVHNLAKYILEQSLLEPTNSCIPNSKKAAAALLLAASIMNPKEPLDKLWCATLVVYSSYKVEHLQEAKSNLQRSFFESHSDQRFRAIREKYALRDYLQVSTLETLNEKVH